MIARVWRGWTMTERADPYEALLRTEIFPAILAKRLPDFERIDLFRCEREHETEFMTVMQFTSREAIAAFTGQDCEIAYVPDSARKLLARFDARATHYELRAGLPAELAE